MPSFWIGERQKLPSLQFVEQKSEGMGSRWAINTKALPLPSSDLLSPARLQLRLLPWGPSVQMREPVGGIFHSNCHNWLLWQRWQLTECWRCQRFSSRAIVQLHSLVGGAGHPQDKHKTERVFTLAHDSSFSLSRQSEIVQPFQKVDSNA